MPRQRASRIANGDEDGEASLPIHRRRPNGNDSDNDPDEDSDEEMETDYSNNVDHQMAKKLIRYALSCEYSRVPIRRDGIKERVLGKQGRSFKKVFELAQKQLREVWGMELRELPVREKTTLHEKRQAMKSNSQPRTGSGAYILASTLPLAYRSAQILPPSKVPSAEEEATYTAFYTMVISLIMLNGGELSDQKLQRYLLRLNADRNVASEKTELVLKKMEKQGYVIKKVERPPVGQDGDHATIWHVGPRAKEEIGVEGVRGLVREVYGHPEDEEFEKKLRSSLGIKARPAAIEEEADEAAMNEDE